MAGLEETNTIIVALKIHHRWAILTPTTQEMQFLQTTLRDLRAVLGCTEAELALQRELEENQQSISVERGPSPSVLAQFLKFVRAGTVVTLLLFMKLWVSIRYKEEERQKMRQNHNYSLLVRGGQTGYKRLRSI